jgi:predicted RecB family nuclease
VLRFLEFVEHPRETYPHSVEHCAICAWKPSASSAGSTTTTCLVANMRRSWIANLADAGITTLEELALA